jgi:flagellar basal body-associated protein FliL
MSHPTQPGQPEESAGADAETEALSNPGPEHEPATEVFPPATPQSEGAQVQPGERRFTAPSGFDAGSTQIIHRPSDPATEQFSVGDQGPTEAFSAQKPATPQVIPPRGEGAKPPAKKRNWGWVIAIVLIIAALAAVAIVGTILLTRGSSASASQEDKVRSTIGDFDVAVQNGDLATLRTITCGTTRDGYVRYDDAAWSATHERVAAAKQYPVVASIDQVVVNGAHAEANVTSFMAFAPQTRSTRSFDLQLVDEQWKICQAPTG